MWLSLVHSAALAIPTLTAPTVVPGDDLIGAAPGDQYDPVLVEGDGTQWLLTWTDTRSYVAGTLGGAQSSEVTDVWGIRLDSAGVPIDTVAFPIASGPWREDSPHAAYGAGSWFVAFDADAPTTFYFAQGVYGARVGADGVVIDTNAILVQDAEDDYEANWDVASDGTDWAVLTQAVDGASYVLDGAMVTADGIVTNGRVYTPPNNTVAPWWVRLQWNVDRYLAVWESWGNLSDVQGLMVDSTLASLGPVFAIASGGEDEIKASVAAGDGGFYVSWVDDTFGGFWVEVEGTPVDLAGAVAIPGGEVLSDTVWPGYPQPDVAWDGDEWVTAWETYDSMWLTYADSAGAVTAMDEAYADVIEPTVAGRADGVLTAWTDYPVHDGWQFGGDVLGAATAGDGTLGVSTPLALGTPAHLAAKIAGSGDQWLVVTQSLSADDSRILGWRLDELAVPIDSFPIEFAVGTGAIQDPAVAWNGSEYLVVWEEYDSVIKNSQIFGVRMDTDGVLLDATPIAIVPGNDPAVAASGTDFLVVSTHEPINHFREVLGVRVDTNGVVLDTTPLDVGGTYALDPDVTGTNNGWVVGWEHKGSHDMPTASIYASIVDTAGVVTPEFTVARDGGADQVDPSLASDGDKTQFVWSGDGNVRGRRMNAAGALATGSAGFVINKKNNDQFGTAVAWTGGRYQVAWTDWRIHDILEPGEGDVYSTVVTTNGTVKDMKGMAISADPDVPEGNVAVGGANGAAVFAWTKMHDEAPYASFRIETAFYGELPVPMIGGPFDGEDAAAEEQVGGQAGGCNTAPGAGLLAGLLSLFALRRRR